MKKVKIIIFLGILALLVGIFTYWRQENTWTYDDYYKCANEGHPTIEPSPPTCFHPDKGKITPGSSK